MLSRRELLQRGAAVAGPALMLGRVPEALSQPRTGVAGMNIIVFITDQERAIQHFPRDWARTHLPGLTRLQDHGLTFENAFCNACMCSPSRATLMTGYFPAQHGVKYTLEENMPDREFPQVELGRHFKNMASVMSAAGYHTVYKGKWHLSKPAHKNFRPSDVAKYGFTRWNPPDAGASQAVDQSGGGSVDNDGRFMDQHGPVHAGKEGVLDYLTSVAPHHHPFFLVVSLVNPHDVLLWPRHFLQAGYHPSMLKGDIELPETVDEQLSTKPIVQTEFKKLMDIGTGRLNTHEKKRAYVNFYGNLMKICDGYVVDILDTLKEQKLLDDTLVIRTSDHGEMGLAHGGQRQKNFNVYEETLRVPLVYSNPRLWSKPATSQVMVSHVDFLPTLASLVNAPPRARAKWQGVDYSDHILQRIAPPPQDYVVFTYDDFQAGQSGGLYVTPPQFIVSLRERNWKIAEYYDINGKVPSQWEMYDLKNDPLERVNLAHRGHKRTHAQQKQYIRLRRKLEKVKAERLQRLPKTPQPITHPSLQKVGPRSATD